MVGAGCEPELRGECFGLLGLEPGGLEVAGGGERVEGGGKQGGAPVTVRGTGYPRAVTGRYPFLPEANPAGAGRVGNAMTSGAPVQVLDVAVVLVFVGGLVAALRTRGDE